MDTSENSKVALLQCETYNAAQIAEKINHGIELLGGWGQWVKPGMNVLLKVNLIGPHTPESASVTHCEFVRAVARILKAQDCTVWIGDSAGGAIGGKVQTEKSFTVAGLEKIAEEEGAILKNFDKEGVVEVRDSDGEPMYLAKPMFDADLVINLPKLKTHMAAAYTGAVKNLFGCIPGMKKAAYHKQAQTMGKFGRIIYDINKNTNTGLHIMDGITAMHKQGPTAGDPYPANKILLSADPLALDTVATKMIGFNIRELPFFKEFIEQGYGEYRIENIKLLGDYTAVPKLSGFKLPHVYIKETSKSGAFGTMIDLVSKKPRISLNKCKQCNQCVNSCPVQAIDKKTKNIDYKQCIECMCCHELCTCKAVELVNVNPVLRFFSGLRKN